MISVADVNYSAMTTGDRWLTGEECAELAGISWSTWRAYVDRGHPVGNPIPKRGPHVRVNPDTRRREWKRSWLQTWLKRRPGHGGRPSSSA